MLGSPPVFGGVLTGRKHMAKIIGTIVAVIVLLVVIYPFAQDAYHRYLVSDRLKTVMTAQERAEFSNWTGDAMSFATRLYQRCELTQGKAAVQCDRYKFAFELR
jgi:hypothetical protein